MGRLPLANLLTNGNSWSGMSSALDKLAFTAAQATRVGWFFGQKMLASRMGRPVPVPEALRGRRMLNRQRILADLRSLIEQDWRNIEAGYYAAPLDRLANPLKEIRRAVDFFNDLRAVEQRRHGVRKERLLTPPPPGRYPSYYLQTFHFQTDGYLSDASAERYDHQVEVLFGGAAAAMRRQALVPLKVALDGRALGGGNAARLLDVACGTGKFLREVKANYPRLFVTGLDLSRHYLTVAQRELSPWSRTRFVEAAAEEMPFADAEFDVVTCIYLFHELPPRIRPVVVAEIRRVIRPGGTVIFVDSLQIGDEPDYDATLELFPVAFHEPYYASYLRENLDRLWSPGFTPGERLPAYFSKVLAYRRDGDSA
jgi:ubiquinone/menaquinone biosynthesis C-methylase UbiE